MNFHNYTFRKATESANIRCSDHAQGVICRREHDKKVEWNAFTEGDSSLTIDGTH